ncbi:DUF485 domain-containing protein [Streptomyces sp. ICBB 8177]|uniref:DUF485 domain-containing protein n=1 Tax=Streptomyces sp. ICBB 8177 TaxID=563922 RepID=UPI000D679EBF|nr:DUF485 domain-containing protein [Streptomyces sp. ICBB 8177]PWI45207.1 hypothetical protein CK485_03365 [Streptomyces sp. ICBB 8177]
MDVHDGAQGTRLGVEDPWAAALDAGPWQEPPRPEPPERTGVYQEVQAGEEFREVRRRYRRFAFPASAAFFVWYLAYLLTATMAPGLMARRVDGAVNVAMVAGLAQFGTTFLLTWAYARHARLRRDRAALELRWDTQERVR